MKIVDANVLLYAVNSASTHHGASRRWLDGALSGSDNVGLALRLSTKAGLFPSPLPPADAMRQVVQSTTAPGATTIGPSARHGDVLHTLLAQLGTGGNRTNDTDLAALAIAHRASIVIYDNDFGRIDGLCRHTPDALPN